MGDRTVRELIEHLTARVAAGRPVRLSPRSAATVVHALRLYAARVGRHQVVSLLCHHKCDTQCPICVGKANEIIRLFEGAPGPFAHDPLFGPRSPGNGG
jgi:hypothetical protein